MALLLIPLTVPLPIWLIKGALGSVVGNPFDVLKTRMMTAEGTYVRIYIHTCTLYLQHCFLLPRLLFFSIFLSWHIIRFFFWRLLLLHCLLTFHFLDCTSKHFFLTFHHRPSPTLHGRCCEKPIQTTRHVLYRTAPYCCVLLITHTHTHTSPSSPHSARSAPNLMGLYD